MTRPARGKGGRSEGGKGGSDRLRESRRDLQRLSGVGPAIADDLISLGIKSAGQLRGKDPILLFRRLQRLTGSPQDPCVLDTFACAIWHAENPKARPRPWWMWSRARLGR